ncbi:f-box protein [Fusarium austroafricanum]|uniref:F-box protein n=1 Tax=Fusarium austroafricanum TaxID=2364996 RepID=A0A8H4NKI9_9HYPO|nr:f-box protein [Fusarium austroafricanum]
MPKRKLPPTEENPDPLPDQDVTQPRPSKRLRFANKAYSPPSRDILTTISSELLLRILSFLTSSELLDISPTSHRLYRLASDPHLWREHYYERFVLPRALRIPGFRVGGAGGTKLQYSARRAVWADGRKGRSPDDKILKESSKSESVDWKRQYKLRHNWARGKCAVEEVSVRDAPEESEGQKRTLVKVVEGIAITADSESGLRAWDLRTRRPIVQLDLHQDGGSEDNAPTSLAVDESGSGTVVDIVVGFADGGFGLWRLNLEQQELIRRYRHEKSSNGELVAVACGYPYVLTATTAGLISLYTFNGPTASPTNDAANHVSNNDKRTWQGTKEKQANPILPPPYLLTSLKSHTTHLPLALSIRRMSSSVSASIAYTFSVRDGWCIGVQDLLITPSSDSSDIDTLSSRLASTLPIAASGSRDAPGANDSRSELTTLCYSHPYLLATLPDNTLVLYLCTSTATSLSLSPGIRLWGHTSGISDAEITPRGKAVSISTRGDEIRVWELEGRVGGSSIEVRPTSRQPADDADTGSPTPTPRAEWEDRRNWVGFDDEMVIVLKEARDGRESLVVYDFT